MTYQELYNQYNGQKGVGNTPQNLGQCVGLVEVFIRGNGLDQVWGDAKDLYANAPEDSFLKIPNTPTAIPQQGDIIIWSGDYNGGAGHTGIATGKGDVNTFDCFEQNDPLGSACHVKTYNYAYVTGWLRFKVQPASTVAVPSDTFTQLVDKSTKYDGFNNAGYTTVDDVNKKVQDLKNQLTDCQNKVVIPVSEVTSSPEVISSTPVLEVLPSTSGDNMPPVETKPIVPHDPVKPRMDIASTIVWVGKNIFSVLIKLWKNLNQK